MEQCCRTCLAILNLNPIFQMEEHHEKYSQVLLDATGIQISLNDSLSQSICTTCISSVNEIYIFRRKCKETQKVLTERSNIQVKTEEKVTKCDSIDISDLLPVDDNVNDSVDNGSQDIETDDLKIDIKTKKDSKQKKKTVKKKCKSETTREKVEIECEYCHKILTSKLSMRNHYKIHTGFDVVCEHCGKKFISRRLLLMHCKAKHGYEKTDKCSFCEYRASNAEQVKIHERLHTGEKPFSCPECGAGFHRRSSYLQHVAIHLPDKTVQCPQCESRFKSVTLMRIHLARHRGARYTYACRVCAHSFARRRNVARHLLRVHDVQPHAQHIERTRRA